MVPLLKNCELDFYNYERTKSQNIPGPFQGMVNPVILQLFDGLDLQRHIWSRPSVIKMGE
jgi:hypothetical protein